MNEFSRMTVVGALEVIASFTTRADMEVLALQWAIDGQLEFESEPAFVAGVARIAVHEDPTVQTEMGWVPLTRAVVEKAIKAPNYRQDNEAWAKFVVGLRSDGFNVVFREVQVTSSAVLGSDETRTDEIRRVARLVRMLPENITGMDFGEAEDEIGMLLNGCGFQVAKGHLNQSMSAFQRGEWSSANGELRNFYESYLNEIAVGLGYSGTGDSKVKRDFLGNLQPPFLLPDYNEWNANNQKPQFVQGLMSRLHPHGGHPGLSEEEDATFRLQISLVTARLFLRRYNQRTNP
jgi:hypothetical protein